MRQLFALMSFLASIHEAENKMATLEEERRLALLTFLATMLDRLADFFFQPVRLELPWMG